MSVCVCVCVCVHVGREGGEFTTLVFHRQYGGYLLHKSHIVWFNAHLKRKEDDDTCNVILLVPFPFTPVSCPFHSGLILMLTNLKFTVAGGPDKDVWNCVWGSRNLDEKWIALRPHNYGRWGE